MKFEEDSRTACGTISLWVSCWWQALCLDLIALYCFGCLAAMSELIKKTALFAVVTAVSARVFDQNHNDEGVVTSCIEQVRRWVVGLAALGGSWAIRTERLVGIRTSCAIEPCPVLISPPPQTLAHTRTRMWRR